MFSFAFARSVYVCYWVVVIINLQEAVEPKRRSSLGLEEEEFKGYEEHYPSARGLVGK